MNIILYRITIQESYSIYEQGEEFSLSPWGKNTDRYKGFDDEGEEYILPDGYEVSESNCGTMEVYNSRGHHCAIIMNGSGLPELIDSDRGDFPILKKGAVKW